MRLAGTCRAPATRRSPGPSAAAVLTLVLLAACSSTGSPDQAGSDTTAPPERESLTHYPIVLSHHWSGDAESAFLGDDYDPETGFEPWGVKEALEDAGAVVYLPDKVPFASHENRGRMLYRSCEGSTVEERLCEGSDPVPIDGVEMAMEDFCSGPDKHGDRFGPYEQCLEDLKINIICHSQGCPDSRYMIAAVTNELTGRPMHEHVASWTSLAGANKGTEIADVGVSILGPCEDEDCGGQEASDALAGLGFDFGDDWGPHLHDSIVALSRAYMTESVDVFCDPQTSDCPPSFNQLYPNPEGILYQTYSVQLERAHPCHAGTVGLWEALADLEGPNDGYISVASQQFLTAGDSPDDPPTHVQDRGLVTVEGHPGAPEHPGIAHMGLSTSPVVGMAGLDCATAADEEAGYEFSRIDFYLDLVRDLAEAGY